MLLNEMKPVVTNAIVLATDAPPTRAVVLATAQDLLNARQIFEQRDRWPMLTQYLEQVTRYGDTPTEVVRRLPCAYHSVRGKACPHRPCRYNWIDFGATIADLDRAELLCWTNSKQQPFHQHSVPLVPIFPAIDRSLRPICIPTQQ